MRPAFVLACACALAALAAALVPGAAATPTCTPTVDPAGTTGAGCRLAHNCYAIVWGYHSEFLTVGGGSSCSGGVWVNPHEAPDVSTDLWPVCTATTAVC